MSARKEISIDKLAIIAGSGTLPRDLYHRAQSLGIECHVIGFKKHTNYITPDLWARVGKASKIVSYLEKHKIQDIVFIGAIDRPNLFSLRPDWPAIKFFIKSWLKSFGDSSLLSAARAQLESMGFHLHGIHHFMPELILKEGVLGNTDIQKTRKEDIYLGVTEALRWGKADKGQAVLVKDGNIIAREDKNGTNHMIRHYGIEGGILVKMRKPQQDKDMDLPTIGPETARLCAKKKMAGIIGHAGHMLVAEEESVIKLANDNGLFIYGQALIDA